MSRFYDITAGFGPLLPQWPSSRGWSASFTQDVRAGDPVTETWIEADVHCGTHVDAPLHHLGHGADVGDLDVRCFWGTVVVQECLGWREVPAESVEALPIGTERVIFRTDNSEKRLMTNAEFDPGFVGLSMAAAKALAELPDLVLVGMDYLSVQPYGGDDAVHRVLLERNIPLLEGLDLSDVPPGSYEISALPILVHGAEGASVRAVLRSTDHPTHTEAGADQQS